MRRLFVALMMLVLGTAAGWIVGSGQRPKPQPKEPPIDFQTDFCLYQPSPQETFVIQPTHICINGQMHTEEANHPTPEYWRLELAGGKVTIWGKQRLLRKDVGLNPDVH